MGRVDGFKIAFQGAGGDSELSQHKTSKPAVPPRQTKPTAGTGETVSHHVNMRVDALHGESALRADVKRVKKVTKLQRPTLRPELRYRRGWNLR